MKFNNFQSVHLFKIIYINLQIDFIYIYILFTIIIMYNIAKIKKINFFSNINYVMNGILILVINIFIIYIYTYTNINTLFMYYLMLYLALCLILLLLYVVSINKIYIITITNIILLGTLYYNYIYLYTLLYIAIIYLYTIKRKNKFYINHIYYFVIIYVLINVIHNIDEFTIQLINTYESYAHSNKLNEVDININYIEYTFNHNKIFINNYYNIYNIFEKIEFNIYNYFINNLYYNIKNNILQIYNINYIVILFTILIIIIKKRY